MDHADTLGVLCFFVCCLGNRGFVKNTPGTDPSKLVTQSIKQLMAG